MYNKIIIALALDHGFSSKAIDLARKLLNEGGQITAVHVSEPVNNTVRVYLQENDIANAQQAVNNELVGRVSSEKDIETVVLIGHPGRTLPEYAEKTGSDCIIMGSHEPGLQDIFLGSTSARVVRHAKCSVHVIRQA